MPQEPPSISAAVPGPRPSSAAPAPPDAKVIDKHSVEYVVRSGVAGGLSGSAAKTLIAPLDRIKILFQTSSPEFVQFRGLLGGLLLAGNRICAAEGPAGLFHGHLVTLLRVFPYAAIKFVAYEQIRSMLIPNDRHETAARRFMAGLLLGLASVFLTYPLDLVRVRMAFDTTPMAPGPARRRSLWAIVRAVYAEHPPRRPLDPRWLRLTRQKVPPALVPLSNFYRGFGPTILGMVPYAGVSFYVHDAIHDLFRLGLLAAYLVLRPAAPPSGPRVVKVKDRQQHVSSRDSRVPLKAYAQLAAGGFAGMFAQTAAYPFEVIRRRMQVGGAVDLGRFMTFRTTTRLIFAENGVRGFFVGLSIGYIKVIPMTACAFYVYERAKLLLGI
ncbi:mitochondrial carrier [Metschnikowia bicuspidata var. bicuspidata NRRL YB-4993]|uniref:Mitochondrial carrier n=1 Tax=Metschnikowia bicuspidata var. bicuspidata NRRL YB-4993 TaxID=869754 RepID=A0A1A0HK65_9ASCO|nr:mitochondrial carrier [Metschnikowia bicuspidata var. bicuspidata NRRL YB-4993]OBA24415.1 mitochondrial carrier [Metschnikowia bicuspidata var. bicuspidata NRRL YB-4993]